MWGMSSSVTTDLVGVTRAAEILDVHRATVWRLVRRGALEAVPIDSRRSPAFERAAVEALAERRRQRKALPANPPAGEGEAADVDPSEGKSSPTSAADQDAA